jgi:hypothetical protein
MSDAISHLKTIATLAHRHGKGVSVDAAMVLALIECAEAARAVAANRRCRTGGGSNISSKIALDAIDSAIDKLEAL